MTHLSHDGMRVERSGCHDAPNGAVPFGSATPSRRGSPARIPDGSGRSRAGNAVR